MRSKERVPLFDQGIAALVEDIYARGLDRDVTVVVWGEFGRTPKINKDAGRDHWSPVNFALLFGGGMRTGQVIGATDKIGAYAARRSVHYHDVLATIYHNLGLDPHTFVKDLSDRPVSILPEGARPIAELVYAAPSSLPTRAEKPVMFEAAWAVLRRQPTILFVTFAALQVCTWASAEDWPAPARTAWRWHLASAQAPRHMACRRIADRVAASRSAVATPA